MKKPEKIRAVVAMGVTAGVMLVAGWAFLVGFSGGGEAQPAALAEAEQVYHEYDAPVYDYAIWEQPEEHMVYYEVEDTAVELPAVEEVFYVELAQYAPPYPLPRVEEVVYGYVIENEPTGVDYEPYVEPPWASVIAIPNTYVMPAGERFTIAEAFALNGYTLDAWSLSDV